MSFTGALQKFRNKSLRKYQTVLRSSSLDLFSSIVLQTPVDTGVLRGNWFAQVGFPDLTQSDSSDSTGTRTISKIRAVIDGVEISDDIYLTNNLPYAIPIEFDGYSAKAPAGMVRVNTLRWRQIVRANTRRVQNGL